MLILAKIHAMRTKYSAENMEYCPHLVLNLLKAEKSFNRSITLDHKKRSLSHEYLLKVFLGSKAIAVKKTKNLLTKHFRYVIL